MQVKINDYGKCGDKFFVCYDVFSLSSSQMNYLNSNLDDETVIDGEIFKIKMYFDENYIHFKVMSQKSEWTISLPVKKLK